MYWGKRRSPFSILRDFNLFGLEKPGDFPFKGILRDWALLILAVRESNCLARLNAVKLF